MASERDLKIKARAYELWEEGGREDGHADAHWAQAMREIGSVDERPSKTRTAATDRLPSGRPAAKSAGTKSAGTKTTSEPAVKPPAKSPAKASAAKASPAKSAASVKSAAMSKKPSAPARAGAKT